jgi:type II secretory ATPase GspE/PulE/Tfp pilus assembly ATPase PilB-like protein
MSDLSHPPRAALKGAAADAPPRFAWPTPDLPGYAAPAPITEPLGCVLEGLNGQSIEGRLCDFDVQSGSVLLRPDRAGRPLTVRADQFRRLHLTEPLLPAEPLPETRVQVPFRVEFHDGRLWSGQTAGCRRESAGLFLFEPADAQAAVLRWFVPRAAFASADVGVPIGQALLDQESASPAQIQEALAEQQALRSRRLGDILVVRQIITADELAAAIARQARMPTVRIGAALTALGFITDAQLEDALVQQRLDRGVPLGELLVRKGLVTRADLQTALARKMGYPLVDVLQFPADAEALSRLPRAAAQRTPALPLMVRAGRLVVAVEDPSNRTRMDELEFAARCKVVPVLARAGVLNEAVGRAYGQMGASDTALRAIDDSAAVDNEGDDAGRVSVSNERVEAHNDEADEPPLAHGDNTLVRLIHSMILQAHAQGVSDIHVECPPGNEKVRIRFRRDGHLKPHLELPPSHRNGLIARLKIMGDLDIRERRKPQDGKIDFAKFAQGVSLELRLATIPTQGNLEDAVLRLQSPCKPIPLESLGLSTLNLARLDAAAQRPHGMLLCVGPVGSGKTTMLHALLARMNGPERKIWTAEDPVEITQNGLRQVQVNPRNDWTFAQALRAILRADPDVIMVGEIRDAETAQLAIDASLSGHLVLSTLHTGGGPGAVTRLLNLAIDPLDLADALLGVLAQRLVRRLCMHCRVGRKATVEEEEELLGEALNAIADVETAPGADATLADWRARFGTEGQLTHYAAAGCAHCGQSGWRGLAGIHEWLVVDRGMRHLIRTGQRADGLQRHALRQGMRTLRQDGIEKVLSGVTTIGEVRANP